MWPAVFPLIGFQILAGLLVMFSAYTVSALTDPANCSCTSSVGGATATLCSSCVASVDKMSVLMSLTHLKLCTIHLLLKP